jgi:peptidoglycan/LPS O-acetylase OafA/YrhL
MRAIAVTFVCISHLIGGPSAPLDLGTIGVRVFFVLSGFLITTLLLNEYDRAGTINLPRFYVRRALRIFPAYYAYLAVIGVAGALGVIQLHRHDLFYGLTYTLVAALASYYVIERPFLALRCRMALAQMTKSHGHRCAWLLGPRRLGLALDDQPTGVVGLERTGHVIAFEV